MALVDAHARRISYLRLSVTDRCNLRCLYCMPSEGLSWIPPQAMLQDAEIVTLLQDVFLPLGLTKIRLTGGEPLLRRGLPELIAAIAGLPGVEDLSLSTNGIFLERWAESLKLAGLRRLNISLDSLRPDRFKEITRGGDLARVLRGIDAALAHGLGSVKLNVVLIPGTNDDEILDFAELTLDRPVHVRFIEMMQVGDKEFAQERRFVPSETVIARIRERHELEPCEARVQGNGPARMMRLPGAPGTVGFITPMSQVFCSACNRLRLTADGQIKACLMRPHEADLLGQLRQGGTPQELQQLVASALHFKPEHHDWGGDYPIIRTMSRIGG